MTAQKKEKQADFFIYGRHTLEEALAGAPHSIKAAYLNERSANDDLRIKLDQAQIAVKKLSGGNFDQTQYHSHQGVIARVDPTKLLNSLEDIGTRVSREGNIALMLLGEVQDPQNVGAIIRSAAAFGMSGVLLPRVKQAPITGAVAKASAGLVFRIPIYSIGNINQTLQKLKHHGFWVYGLDQNGDHSIEQESFDRPSVFVMGNEAYGLRQEVRKNCDINLQIPLSEQAESLNVSAAAAIAAYVWRVNVAAKTHDNK